MLKQTDKNTTQKPRPKWWPLVKFILILLVCAMLGAMSSMLLLSLGEQVGVLGDVLNAWLADVLPVAQWVSLATFILLSQVFYWLAHTASLRLQKSGNEDEQLSERAERLLGLGMLFNNLMMVIGYGLYGMGAAMLSFKSLQAIGCLAILIFIIVYTTAYSTHAIKTAKRLCPEKKGNPLELRFEKDWFNSCDEAEKMGIYQASYAAYRATNMTLLVLWMVAVILSLFWDIGVLPVLFVSIIWVVSSLSYQLACLKANKKTGK